MSEAEYLVDFWYTWHQPMLGALHVMGIAWFGATLFAEAPRLRQIGLTWMLTTGATLFVLSPERTLASTSFRMKMALLAALFFVRQPRWLVLALWVAVIFAARGIAYF